MALRAGPLRVGADHTGEAKPNNSRTLPASAIAVAASAFQLVLATPAAAEQTASLSYGLAKQGSPCRGAVPSRILRLPCCQDGRQRGEDEKARSPSGRAAR